MTEVLTDDADALEWLQQATGSVIDLSELERAKDRREQNRRAYVRWYYSTPTHVTYPDGTIESLYLRDISGGGMSITSKNPPQVGEQLIIAVEDIGRFEVDVVRRADDHFAVAVLDDYERLAEHAEFLEAFFSTRIDGADLLAPAKYNFERRAADRYCVCIDGVGCVGPDGAVFESDIVNVSLGGMEIKTTGRLEIGDVIQVGRACAIVRRKTGGGYGLERVVEDMI